MARFDCFMLKSLSVEYGRTRQDLKRARAVFRPLFLIYCYRDCGGGGAGRAIARLPLFCWDLLFRAPVDIIGLCPKRWTVAVLNGHKQRTDSISIATQEFVSRNENRERNFSTAFNFKK